MTRGRKRKHDPTIASSIEQGKLPAGIYWNPRSVGRWYVIETGESGKRAKRTVATHEAKLSDLHRIVEEFRGVDRGTLSFLLDEFHASETFRGLAEKTRRGYEFYRRHTKMMPT